MVKHDVGESVDEVAQQWLVHKYSGISKLPKCLDRLACVAFIPVRINVVPPIASHLHVSVTMQRVYQNIVVILGKILNVILLERNCICS